MFIEVHAFCPGFDKANYHECRWYKAEESFIRVVKKYRECVQCADFNAICSDYGDRQPCDCEDCRQDREGARVQDRAWGT